MDIFTEMTLLYGTVISHVMVDKATYLAKNKVPVEALDQLGYTVTSSSCKVIKADNDDVREFLAFQAQDAREKMIDHFLSSAIPQYDNSSKKARLNLV